MNVELLHIADCPSWVEAGVRLREAMDATGFDDTAISYRLVGAADLAGLPSFAGSPTLLVDGEDLFPGGGRTSDLACRVYVTPTGLAGLPTTDQMIHAIRTHGR